MRIIKGSGLKYLQLFLSKTNSTLFNIIFNIGESILNKSTLRRFITQKET